MPLYLILLIQLSFSYVSTFTFAIIINIPRKGLNTCAWIGASGWMTYWLFTQFGAGKMLGNLTGALVIGVFSSLMAPVKKTPALLFNIPALVPLVPGATAFEAVRFFVLGKSAEAFSYLLTVLMVIGSISVGFMVAQLFGEIFRRLGKWRYH